ncbi:hypothetical protein SLH46_04890 [Draconibacterium sp. IB214405]|uniref:hypothetical protein n=1 Tax=Draconibacterium sp. IB214405 TaxID=3097352 RepID=UPI002A0B0828|nr:hypothetical protein [Draconibacterium sp. IB214405]MDX8338506.1 hypothetical protein [Draconibacterium sp. IB214405]
MYQGLLHAHNGFRWLVLIMLVVSVIMGFAGWIGKRNWGKANNLTGLILVMIMDIQFLLGIVLYAFVSPITKAAFANFGAAMKNPELRFYAVEHFLMMFIALALVHIGRAKSKKDVAPWKKHQVTTLFFGIALILILAAIPWDRAFF